MDIYRGTNEAFPVYFHRNGTAENMSGWSFEFNVHTEWGVSAGALTIQFDSSSSKTTGIDISDITTGYAWITFSVSSTASATVTAGTYHGELKGWDEASEKHQLLTLSNQIHILDTVVPTS